jgi:naphthalene 1,2-dioxygenase system ferredoxin subunit
MSEVWYDAVGVDEVPDDDVIQVTAGGEAIALYRLGGRFYATSDTCTHGGACLSDGFVIGDEIECPLHQGRFHIATGEARGAPATEALDTYPTKIENGRVLVQVRKRSDQE